MKPPGALAPEAPVSRLPPDVPGGNRSDNSTSATPGAAQRRPTAGARPETSRGNQVAAGNQSRRTRFGPISRDFEGGGPRSSRTRPSDGRLDAHRQVGHRPPAQPVTVSGLPPRAGRLEATQPRRCTSSGRDPRGARSLSRATPDWRRSASATRHGAGPVIRRHQARCRLTLQADGQPRS
jgi:hypothetical protein